MLVIQEDRLPGIIARTHLTLLLLVAIVAVSICVQFLVMNNGVGIDDGVRDKIFYPFFTTKTVGKGTGLGLTISYGVVQNHGGEILAESRKGHGSTFRIKLPI